MLKPFLKVSENGELQSKVVEMSRNLQKAELVAQQVIISLIVSHCTGFLYIHLHISLCRLLAYPSKHLIVQVSCISI